MKAWEHDTTVASLNALARDINDWAVAKGFWNHRTGILSSENIRQMRQVENTDNLVKTTKIMLVVTELAELVEGLRKAEVPGTVAGFTNEEEEVADAIIRLLDYSGAYGLRIGEALSAKMAKNTSRPYKHGKQF